ncbi:bifunctional hydroxymethylpyrimidine kinase/phosphomethylpyrimidine kinase [Kytococcus sp. Marseille-QA3725]
MSAPTVLSVAGSDPSGGAGIQADLKTFSALGAYGCAAMTALTAQSTQGVTGIHAVPPEFVRQQVTTLVDDVRLDAVKIGMLGTVEVAEAVAGLVREVLRCPVVLDPVMVSTAGSRLLDASAVEAVCALAPHVDVVTPNGPEAAVMLGVDGARDVDEQVRQAVELQCRLGTRVLLKGGHLPGDPVVDVWVDEGQVHTLDAPRVHTGNTHGTGCTLSSAIAALYPQRDGWLEAVTDAKAWLTEALRHADELQVGHGAGPVHHFHTMW